MARAIKGGEFGANGEWYEGGKFLNTRPDNAKNPGSKPKVARKAQVAPYQWEVMPEGCRSLFEQLAGTFARPAPVGQMRLMPNLDARVWQHFSSRTVASVTAQIEAYNRGEKWEAMPARA